MRELYGVCVASGRVVAVPSHDRLTPGFLSSDAPSNAHFPRPWYGAIDASSWPARARTVARVPRFDATCIHGFQALPGTQFAATIPNHDEQGEDALGNRLDVILQ
jgi:hypothetical protein